MGTRLEGGKITTILINLFIIIIWSDVTIWLVDLKYKILRLTKIKLGNVLH